jgi:hypothetical protein
LLLWRSKVSKPPARQTPEWLSTFALKVKNFLAVIEAESDALRRSVFDIGHLTLGVALVYTDFRFGDVNWVAAIPEPTLGCKPSCSVTRSGKRRLSTRSVSVAGDGPA